MFSKIFEKPNIRIGGMLSSIHKLLEWPVL